jgi:UDP-N-acetylglucosamine 2-epimerase (non-hydrolysing)/UDP-GlcNAc3NAcA epimerase
MRVVTVVGNRPQFVKAAAVSRPLRERHEEVLVHTGQHYDDDMSQVFFDELPVPEPDVFLGVGSAAAAVQTGRMLEALAPVVAERAPELVIVYGDTNSTLAGALAGAQAHVPVAHVEAGMRSFDRTMPEELNRVLTDHASDLLLCSTQTAVDNLAREGVDRPTRLVGDTMADVALATARVASERRDVLSAHGVSPGAYLLVTAHRAGNVDDPERLSALVDLLLALPRPVVFPVHPRTRARLEGAGLLDRLAAAGGVVLTPPLGYVELLALVIHSRAVVTDSGGLQKEAYLVAVPCVTLRDRTEWVETVDAGWNTLVGLDPQAAVAALERQRPADHPDLYGGGRAGTRIRDAIDAFAAARG